MKVFIVGGTGLLGSEGAKVLIERGHEVTAIALPPLPAGAELPPEMKVEFGNYLELSDDELRQHLTGMDAIVFAAGVDERVEAGPPIYELYRKYNIEPVRRLFGIAKQCGVRHAVVCGSYFSYFDREWPEMKLAETHPYIASRKEQERVALSFADDTFDVAVLELPYIFGVQKGRKPVWVRGDSGRRRIQPRREVLSHRVVQQDLEGDARHLPQGDGQAQAQDAEHRRRDVRDRGQSHHAHEEKGGR